MCLGRAGRAVLSVGADGAGTLCAWDWQGGRVRGGAIGVCGGRWERILGVAACGLAADEEAAADEEGLGRLACWAVTFGAGHVAFWSVWERDSGEEGGAEEGADYVDDSDGPRWRVEGGAGRLCGVGVAQTALCAAFVAVRDPLRPHACRPPLLPSTHTHTPPLSRHPAPSLQPPPLSRCRAMPSTCICARKTGSEGEEEEKEAEEREREGGRGREGGRERERERVLLRAGGGANQAKGSGVCVEFRGKRGVG